LSRRHSRHTKRQAVFLGHRNESVAGLEASVARSFGRHFLYPQAGAVILENQPDRRPFSTSTKISTRPG
jgi:hypothetical protein